MFRYTRCDGISNSNLTRANFVLVVQKTSPKKTLKLTLVRVDFCVFSFLISVVAVIMGCRI